jgi:signal transduction histidine kinase
VNVTRRLAARTETAANAALALVLGAVLAADTAMTAHHNGGWGFELAVGAVVCTVAVFRGRNRILAAAAGLAVGGLAAVASDVFRLPSQPGVAASLGLLVLGAAAIRTAVARPAVIIAVAGVAVLVAGRGDVRREYIVPLAFLGVLAWGGALVIGVWLRLGDARRRLAFDDVRRDERLELARELHDVVAHHIAGVVVQAQAAQLVAAKRPDTLPDTLASIESAGNDALAAMRRVVSLLRDLDDAVGLAPAPEQLSDLVGRFAGHGRAVQLSLPDADQPPWPPEVATTVYRIVQESLTNIVIHAPGAANVAVSIAAVPSGVSIEVTNDGPAISSWFAADGGYGLAGMRERVDALSGTLLAGPDPDGGWAVRATVPLPAGSAGSAGSGR